ncbi:MAG: DUF4258 domain-containing protein [archaeon]
MRKQFFFSKHYRKDKEIDTDLTISCIETGKRVLNEKPNKYKSRKKYRKGELIVVWKNRGEKCFVVTAYWNKRR